MPHGKTDNSEAARLRRIEWRLSNFMKWNGYSPTREVSAELVSKVTELDGALHCTTPLVTVGDLAQAVYRYHMDGDVPVYLNGIRVGVFNISGNSTERRAANERAN